MTVNEFSAIIKVIKNRRSIRRYGDRPVPEDIIRQVLEAARWGPSAHNRQPWRFAVLTSPSWKVRLARRMGEQFRADLLRDGAVPEDAERQVTRSVARISQAPAVIVLFLSMAVMDHYPDGLRQAAERVMAVQSVALAAQNLLLAAHALGLGACWMCAPLFCPDLVRDELALPQDWEAQGLITLGYPAEQRQSEREPVDGKTRWY